MRFLSDNSASVCPAVMAAVLEANVATVSAYDGDTWSQRLDAVFSAFFGTPCRVWAVTSGTAANALALASLVQPYGAVLCHEEAHIQVDEAGAPGFYTHGASLLLCGGDGAKLTPEICEATWNIQRGDVHQVQPQALSITQATEYGRVYTAAEVEALCGWAKAKGLRVHMDGARFANALVHLGCAPADITWKAGVDVLSFGAIKNGSMSAEALVFFDDALAQHVPHLRKRGGHMPSKGRFGAAQLLAMIESGAWAENARAANQGASLIAEAAGGRLLYPVQANEIFLRLRAEEAAALRAQGFAFYDWGAAGSGLARFVVSWDQDPQDISALAAALKALG